jgi:RHS repeat-associated protein
VPVYTWGADDPTTTGASDNEDDLIPRGFTGHEMMDDLGLIHMNGRIYDPRLGRFLSADQVVQAPLIHQSYNRYSYCFNNHLGLVDPSGYEGTPPDWLARNMAPFSVAASADDASPVIEYASGILDRIVEHSVSDVMLDESSVSSSNEQTISESVQEAESSQSDMDFEVFAGLDLDLAPVLGVEVNAGIKIDFEDPMDSGVYGSSCPSAGVNGGIGLAAGCALRGVEGNSDNIDINAGASSVTLSYDDQGLNGASYSYGPGAGCSVSNSNTETYTISDLCSDVSSLWKELTH